MTNNVWLPIVVDYLYIKEDKIKDIFAHAKVVSKIDEDDYYELMIPSHDFLVCYITKEKIKKFLWKLTY